MALNCVYLTLIASTVVLGFVEPTAGGFCDGKHNGDYNDPNNCYGFITCSNGIAYKRDCPDHLKFDQATDRCEYNVDCFPVDGGWSDWSPWYPCSVSCGGGKQLKFRTCTNPRPSHGGKYCVGPNKLSRVCNRQPCPGGFCYGKPNGDYSDPDNCYGFITCSNGIAYKRDCPDHLKFNQTTDRCEHNVDCFPGLKKKRTNQITFLTILLILSSNIILMDRIYTSHKPVTTLNNITENSHLLSKGLNPPFST